MSDNLIKSAEKSKGLDANGEETAAKGPQINVKSPKRPKSPKSTLEDIIKEKGLEECDALGIFSEKIRKNDLPEIIQKSVEHYVKPRKTALLMQYFRQLDMVLLSFLIVFSGVLPNYKFYYRNSWYYASLMGLIVASAGLGKSVMEPVFELIKPIHDKFRMKYQELKRAYDEQQQKLKFLSKKEQKELIGDLLEKPDQLYFRIPTDSTYAAFMKGLARMNGFGELLDTEIDAILTAFKNEMGDYSVFLRKNFKHESHSYVRKTDDEYREIPEPKFAMLLSGTLDQMEQFIHEVQSGLFSRFCIYWNTAKPEWVDEVFHDVVPQDDKSFYREIGEKVLTLYNVLESLEEPLRFRLTEKQLAKFNKNFAKVHISFTSLDGEDMHASVVRMAVIFHRIAMVLSIFRYLDQSEEEMQQAFESKEIVCLDKDFNTAMTISMVLMEHASAYFEHITRMSEDADIDMMDVSFDSGNSKVNEAIKSIPSNKVLTTDELIQTMIEHNVPRSTAKKKIRRLCQLFVFEKVEHGKYRKSTHDEYLMKTEAAKKAKKIRKQADKNTKNQESLNLSK